MTIPVGNGTKPVPLQQSATQATGTVQNFLNSFVNTGNNLYIATGIFGLLGSLLYFGLYEAFYYSV